MSGSNVSARITDLSPAQRALLEQRIRGKAKADRGEEQQVRLSIPRRSDREVAPLSLAQEGLWLLTQAVPGTVAYNYYGSLRLRGKLNGEMLAASLTEVVRRHEILRTSFQIVDGAPVQVVLPAAPLALDIMDFTDVAESEQSRVVRSWAIEQGRRPLDLERGEVFRVHLLRLRANLHVFLMTVHHIVSDGWSFGLLFRELLVIYNALSQQQDIPLANLPIQYGDYAAWQRSLLSASRREAQLAYWREKLSGASLLLDLPIDRPRPSTRSFEGGWLALQLPPDLAERTQIFCRQQRVTLFMVLLSAYAILLQRCSGSSNVLIGSPVADRPAPEVEGLIGLFVNTLVFRTDFDDDPKVVEFIGRVRSETVRAYEHRMIPFDSLIGALGILREQSHSPVFQTMFALMPPRSVPLSVQGLDIEPGSGAYTGSRFDLSLAIEEAGDALFARWEYPHDVFEASTINRLAQLYHQVLDAMTSGLNCRVSELRLPLTADPPVPKREPARDLSLSPATDAPLRPIEETLSARFAARVRANPQGVAVVDDGVTWTYAELDRHSSQVAGALLERLGPQARMVALMFDHGAPMIAAILGVLKAGLAYVPLNPLHPVERLRFILQDTGAAAIVSNDMRQLVEEVRGILPVIEFAGPVSEPAAPLPQRSPDSLAYVLYTSGSSGKPKGVLQNDRNVLYFIDEYVNALGVSRDDRLSLVASYGFDAAVMDIFAALLSGASLYLRDLRRSGYHNVADWLERHKLTIWHSTPTVFRLVAPCLDPNSTANLRFVVLGGEEALGSDVELLKMHFPQSCVLVNGYGPTEATVVTQHIVPAGERRSGSVLPIGVPLAATEVVLFNSFGRPTEFVGEIGVRTPHTALGYLNAPRLTAERFVPSPFGTGERIYLTGDIARRRWDGNLEFLGRRDDQVKIRGQRVELGEVEAVLMEHGAVAQAAVLAMGEGRDDRHLIAFVAPAEEQVLDRERLLAHLRSKLPDYLVPKTITLLDKLPVSPNGKVDRSALLALPPEPASARQSFIAPRTQTETQLAKIWATVLNRELIEIDDNFFDVGGDSLRLIRIHYKLSHELGHSVPITKLFAHPTIRALAADLAGERDEGKQVQIGDKRAQTRRQSVRRRSLQGAATHK